MALTNYTDGKILDQIFGGTAWSPPATLYFGLSTTTIYADGTGITEPSGGLYARVAVTNNVTNFPANADSFAGLSPTATQWAGTTVYGVNSNVYPTAQNGHYYTATAVSGTGTSSGTQPTWPTTEGATVIDNAGANQITWTCHAVPGKQKQNGTAITWPTSNASWSTVTYWFASDLASGGNIVAMGALTSPQTIGASNTVSFNGNSLTIQQQ